MSSSTATWLPGLVAGLVAGVASGAGGVYWHMQQVEERLSKRPPVAYINIGSAAAQAASTGNGQKLLEEVRTKSERLAAAGYLVLDADSLIDAPRDLHVPLTDYSQSDTGDESSESNP